jgi:hypothetical protein
MIFLLYYASYVTMWLKNILYETFVPSEAL